MVEGIDYAVLLMHAGFAFIAGIIKGLYKSMNERFNWKKLIIGSLTSSFSGLLMFLLVTWLGFQPYLVGSLVGIAGWLGGDFVDFLGKVVKKFITKKLDIDDL